MASELEKAIEVIAKATSGLEAREKELKSSIRALEGEFQIARSEYKEKNAKLRSDAEIELKEIQKKIEPERLQARQLREEVDSLKSQVAAAQNALREIKSAKNLYAKESIDALNKEIAKRQLTLDGINHAINEARKMIGVH